MPPADILYVMNTSKRKTLNIRKATRFAIIVNIMEMVTMLAMIGYLLLSRHESDRFTELAILLVGLVFVAWGAVLDIREARSAQRVSEQAIMLEDAYRQLESLNGTLRKQRHDFKNHLQVVFSLMEMEEYAEARQYIESVYQDIQKTGSSLRTAIPALNALIAAKRADCESRGIELRLDIRSAWQDMPVSGWELCRVLGNLIDNALDALAEARPDDPFVSVTLDETAGGFVFAIVNNGPAIPPQHLEAIFREGFTTKSAGHGAGLSIVREILESYGGGIRVKSDAESTVFSGVIPRKSA